jgi:hypothetical protein
MPREAVRLCGARCRAGGPCLVWSREDFARRECSGRANLREFRSGFSVQRMAATEYFGTLVSESNVRRAPAGMAEGDGVTPPTMDRRHASRRHPSSTTATGRQRLDCTLSTHRSAATDCARWEGIQCRLSWRGAEIQSAPIARMPCTLYTCSAGMHRCAISVACAAIVQPAQSQSDPVFGM